MLLYVISVAGQVVLIDMMFPDMRLGPIRFGEAVKLPHLRFASLAADRLVH